MWHVYILSLAGIFFLRERAERTIVNTANAYASNDVFSPIRLRIVNQRAMAKFDAVPFISLPRHVIIQ
jgi:hypothetical protein